MRRAVVLAALGGVAALLLPAGNPSPAAQEPNGRILYEARCASCHGLRGEGGADAPPLLGRGAATVDFVLSTGRMPLADPTRRMARRRPAFSRAEIDAIVRYVEEIAPGGPPIPRVDTAAGDLALGRTIYADNCLACHGAGLQGSSVGGGAVAPSLSRATPREIGEAVRIGPGVMPPFGPDVIDDHGLDSLVRYIDFERRARQPGGLGIGRVGPVAEGFIAWFAGLGFLLVVLRLAGKRA